MKCDDKWSRNNSTLNISYKLTHTDRMTSIKWIHHQNWCYCLFEYTNHHSNRIYLRKETFVLICSDRLEYSDMNKYANHSKFWKQTYMSVVSNVYIFIAWYRTIFGRKWNMERTIINSNCWECATSFWLHITCHTKRKVEIDKQFCIC